MRRVEVELNEEQANDLLNLLDSLMDKTLSNEELARAKTLREYVRDEIRRQNPYASPPGYMSGDDYDC